MKNTFKIQEIRYMGKGEGWEYWIEGAGDSEKGGYN
jgi:hypothetical protein